MRASVYSTPEEALSIIKSGDRVFIHGSACTPTFLLQQLAERGNELSDVELVSISLYGDVFKDRPDLLNSTFRMNSLFVSAPIRQDVNEGRADYVPVF